MGWLGLGTYVLVYDAWAIRRGRPTLSAQFAAGCTRQRLVVGALTAFVVLHLYDRIPRRWDVLHLLAAVLTPHERQDSGNQKNVGRVRSNMETTPVR